jgi:hypothetical protein
MGHQHFYGKGPRPLLWVGLLATRGKITVLYLTDQIIYITYGARGGTVVETLRYKPEGSGIDSRWCHW